MLDIPYEYLQGGGYVGPEFTSVFLFQGIFWRMVIPLVFGRVCFNVIESLVMMPADIRHRLCADLIASREYKAHWADCLDYDTGFQMLEVQPVSGHGQSFVASSRRDLLTCTADLSQGRPNSNAMQAARLATEKAMKAFLCISLCVHGGNAQKAILT